jgi:hypothetical protein
MMVGDSQHISVGLGLLAGLAAAALTLWFAGAALSPALGLGVVTASLAGGAGCGHIADRRLGARARWRRFERAYWAYLAGQSSDPAARRRPPP